jgi:hypothetical protein
MNASEAGLTTSAFWVSSMILSMHSPEPSGMASTWISFPSLVLYPPSLKVAVTSFFLQFCYEPQIGANETANQAEPQMDAD